MVSTCYLILTLVIIGAFTGFVMDFIKKYNDEITKEIIRINECKTDFKNNRCDDPVPQLL